jgi:hypothetical protein
MWMTREVAVDMLGLRCALRVVDWRLVAEVDAVFGGEGILSPRIVHCSVERVVDIQRK